MFPRNVHFQRLQSPKFRVALVAFKHQALRYHVPVSFPLVFFQRVTIQKAFRAFFAFERPFLRVPGFVILFRLRVHESLSAYRAKMIFNFHMPFQMFVQSGQSMGFKSAYLANLIPDPFHVFVNVDYVFMHPFVTFHEQSANRANGRMTVIVVSDFGLFFANVFRVSRFRGKYFPALFAVCFLIVNFFCFRI